MFTWLGRLFGSKIVDATITSTSEENVFDEMPVAHCGFCGAPIYGPASLEVSRFATPEQIAQELSKRIISFCRCNQGFNLTEGNMAN